MDFTVHQVQSKEEKVQIARIILEKLIGLAFPNIGNSI